MKIELKQRILNDKYTAYVCEAFDIQNKDFSVVNIEANLENLPKQWNIGVIYGGSGSGKTTILKKFFNKDIDNSLLRAYPVSTYTFEIPDYFTSIYSNELALKYFNNVTAV